MCTSAKDSLHSPACSAETATPKTGNSPSLEQRRELLKKARDCSSFMGSYKSCHTAYRIPRE